MKKSHAPFAAIAVIVIIIAGFWVAGFDFNRRGGMALLCYFVCIVFGAITAGAVRDLGK